MCGVKLNLNNFSSHIFKQILIQVSRTYGATTPEGKATLVDLSASIFLLIQYYSLGLFRGSLGMYSKRNRRLFKHY